jgi:hypothetical protein
MPHRPFNLTNQDNVDKLFRPGNHPAFWGLNGERVMGTIPPVYLLGESNTYQNANGSGGNWPPVGDSLTDVLGPA